MFLLVGLISCGENTNEDTKLSFSENIKTKENLIDDVSIIKFKNQNILTKNLGQMNWYDAKKACSDLGDGWRLPTKYELFVIFNNHGKDDNCIYWSSTQVDNYELAWVKNFNGGGSYGLELKQNKNTIYCVKAVHSEIDLSKKVNYDTIRRYYQNGKLKSEDNYRDGEPFGLWRTWYQNGQLKDEVNIKNGKRDGFHLRWFENGQLQNEINIKNGERNGLRRSWYENGQLASEANFKDGKNHGLRRGWYENGQLSSEKSFKHGNSDGLDRTWYENGQLASETSRKDGQEHGLSRGWCENGKLKIEQNWWLGQLQGISKESYENCADIKSEDDNKVKEVSDERESIKY